MNLASPDMSLVARKYGENRLAGRDPAENLTSVAAQKIVIVNTANRPWAVVDSQALFAKWAELNPEEIYYSPNSRPFEDTSLPIDKDMQIVESETALTEALRVAKPSIVFLRVSPHTRSEYLVCLIRVCFPQVCLLVEFYDASCLFDDTALDYIYAGDAAKQHAALEGCAVAFFQADGLILKMGGPAYESWIGGIHAPAVTFFPSLETQAQIQKPNQTKARRALFAGSISARELTHGIGSVHGANCIKYFDTFSGQEFCSLGIFNAAHNSRAEDTSTKFSALMNRYKAVNTKGDVTYHRAVPRQKLLQLASSYDIGICCTHYADDHVMDVTRFGLPNKMMTYIDAGLPIIIDDRYEYAAQLVKSFDAGVVVPAGDFQRFIQAVQDIDIKKAAAGLANLKRHMVGENFKSFERLRHLTENKRFSEKSTIE